MTKKRILWITAIIVVAGIYYYLYRDSFARRDLQVRVSMRPKIGRKLPRLENNDEGNPMVIFSLGNSYKLTSVAVFSLSDVQTNKYPHALWQLVTESNSAPTDTFAYGGKIHGMHPAISGLLAEALSPDTDYRIVVKAGSSKGEHDFKTLTESNPSQ